MRQEVKNFLEMAGFIVVLCGLVLAVSIMNVPDGLKYFIVTIIFLILLVVYIQTAIVERIEMIEEKIKEKK